MPGAAVPGVPLGVAVTVAIAIAIAFAVVITHALALLVAHQFSLGKWVCGGRGTHGYPEQQPGTAGVSIFCTDRLGRADRLVVVLRHHDPGVSIFCTDRLGRADRLAVALRHQDPGVS